MADATPSKSILYRVTEHPPFERIALLLQGGGELGSYQAGAYQALAEANLEPERVAGISIGALNSALIAGNPPETRVEKLREFWEAVSTPPLGVRYLKSIEIADESTRRFVNQPRALGILLFCAPRLFEPSIPSPLFWASHLGNSVSHYDVGPLKVTLERLVDFDRINAGSFFPGAIALAACSDNGRATVGVVNRWCGSKFRSGEP